MKSLLYIAPLLFICSCIEQKPKQSETITQSLDSIFTISNDSCGEPYLFSDSNGLVYLSWIEKRSGQSELKFSILEEGKWKESKTIASGNNWVVNWADFPAIAANNGAMLASFLEKSDSGKYSYNIKYISFADKSSSWSASKILHDDGKQAEHGFVSMVPYGNKFFVSWLDGRNTAMESSHAGHEGHHGQMTLRAAIIDQEGNKLNEWELDNRVCDCCQTSAVMTSKGPVVVYRDRSDSEIRDISIVRFIDNKWTEPKTIHADNWKIEGCPVNGPRIDAINNTIAIAWFSMQEKKGMVNMVFSKDGGENFSEPIRIDEGSTIGRVDIVMMNDTSAVVSWIEGNDIKAAKVSMHSGKTKTYTIAQTSQNRSSGFPQMTKAKDKIIFAWTDDIQKRIKTAIIPFDRW